MSLSTQKANYSLEEDTPVMLVTGGAKRIGAAIIKAAHDKGYRIIIHCHRSKPKAEH